jgi:hypothetical protein
MLVESSRWKLIWAVLLLHLNIVTAQTENQNTEGSQMPRESTNSTAFLLELAELGKVCYQPHLVRARSLLRAGTVHDPKRSRLLRRPASGNMPEPHSHTRVLQGRCSQVKGNEDMFANCGQRKDAVSCLHEPDDPSDANSNLKNSKCEVCCAKFNAVACAVPGPCLCSTICAGAKVNICEEVTKS